MSQIIMRQPTGPLPSSSTIIHASGATLRLTLTPNPAESADSSDLLAERRDTHYNSHSTTRSTTQVADRSIDAPITVETFSFLPTRATAATEIPSNSLESSVARTNPAEDQEPTNHLSTLFIQPEMRVSRSTCHVSGFNPRQAIFIARPIDVLIPSGRSPFVFRGVHPAHPSSSGADIGSQSIEPGDRNDVPRRGDNYFDYELFESHIGNPFHPFHNVNPNSPWISASEQRICIALANFFLDVQPCEADYLFLARQVYTLPDIQLSKVEELLRHDVLPALWPQLLTPVPEWTGFDSGWLLSVIEYRRRCKLYAFLTEPFFALLWLLARSAFRPLFALTKQWLERLESGEEIDLDKVGLGEEIELGELFRQ